MPMTYFVTDSQGHTYMRSGSGHDQQRYRWALVMRREGDPGPMPAHRLAFSVKRSVVEGLARKYQGRHDDTGRLILPEVVPVRGYPGRWKHEPRDIGKGAEPHPATTAGDLGGL